MRIIFMGTPDFALPSLKALIDSHEVVAVYTQPPRPQGRGHVINKSSVHLCAEEHDIEVFYPSTFKSFDVEKQIKSQGAEAIVVVAYGQLLPLNILSIPKYGCINVHASLLPRWRGAAPIQRAILSGDLETGISIMAMDAGLDSGAILEQEKIFISPTSTTITLHNKLSQLGAHLLINVLGKINLIQPQVQPQIGITYANKIEKKEGLLSWQETPVTLERKIRALNPWPGVWFDDQGILMKVLSGEAILINHNLPFGTFAQNNQHPLIIACQNGFLKVNMVQKPGSKAIYTADFLRGSSFRNPIINYNFS